MTEIPTASYSSIAIEPLSQQLAALLEQLEYMEQQEQPYIMALYQSSLGELEYRLLNLQVECRSLQQRIELAMIKLNRGELLTRQHLSEIEQQVQQGLLEWQTQLAAQSQAMAAGRAYLSGLTLANPDEVQRAKQAYRRLARVLHPDINPRQQPLFEQYWPSIQKAYGVYDADMLEALLHVVTRSLSPTQSSESDDTVMLARLSALIARHSERLIQLRNEPPFCWAEVLQDADWIAARQADLENEIEVESQRWTHLIARYASISAQVVPVV